MVCPEDCDAGDVITVQTEDGEIEIEVPEGVQPGEAFEVQVAVEGSGGDEEAAEGSNDLAGLLSSSEEDDENLKEIMDFLKKEDIYPFAEVDFSGAGDDGYIDDNLYVDAGLKPLRKTSNVPGLEDYLYNMLGDYGGWMNDEGSFGNFMIDSRAGTITLKFIWNEYAYEDVVFNQEEF